jgi:uncharacterized protein involved in exopolysaccharide biosynthesis
LTEFNFLLIRNRIIAGWRTPALLAAVAVVLAVVMLALSRPVYSVKMTVMPAPSAQSGIASGGTGSTITSLFNLGISQTNSDYVRYQRLIGSTIVAERLQRDYGLLQYVYADMWDKKNKRWIERRTWRNYVFGWLFAIAHVPMWTPPDIASLASYIDGAIIIKPSTQTDIVGLSMDSKDPAYARRILLLVNLEANEVLRNQVATRAKQKAAYLRNELNQVSVEDYRQALLALLSNEEKTLMFTETSHAFAAEILSPPTASAIPVSPRPIMSLFVAALIGILLGTTLVVFLGPDWWKTALARLPSFGGRNRYAAPAQARPAHR